MQLLVEKEIIENNLFLVLCHRRRRHRQYFCSLHFFRSEVGPSVSSTFASNCSNAKTVFQGVCSIELAAAGKVYWNNIAQMAGLKFRCGLKN